MTDIVEKLTFWQTVYPEDAEDEASIFNHARKEIIHLREVVKAHKDYPTLYNYCICYLNTKKKKSEKGYM